jgi:hypothetical protein
MNVVALAVGRGPRRFALALAAALLSGGLAGTQPASAQAPFWRLSSRSAPTYLPLQGEPVLGGEIETNAKGETESIAGEGTIVASATNLSAVYANKDQGVITVTDQLPPALEPIEVRGFSGLGLPGGADHAVPMSCPKHFENNRVACTFERQDVENFSPNGKAVCAEIAATFPCGSIPPFEHLELRISVKSKLTKAQLEQEEAEKTAPLNVVSVEGGEAATPPALEQKLKFGADEEVAGKPVSRSRFGTEQYEFTPETENGQPDTQAGDHPFQLTTTFDLNQTFGFSKEFGRVPQSPAEQKDLSFKIPPGVLGNPDAVPQCPDVQFGAIVGVSGVNECPDNTAIGVATVAFYEPITFGPSTWSVPVFNLVPAPGEPAKFGFEITHVPVVLDTSVRTGEDYGVTVHVHNTSAAVQVLGAQVTLWGTPGDPSHDSARGWACIGNGRTTLTLKPRPECAEGEKHEKIFEHPKPFLVMPTKCKEPLSTETEGSAWTGETFKAKNEPPFAQSAPVELEGCEKLPFALPEDAPSITVTPDTSSASTPTGMTVEVTVPQQKTTMSPNSLGEADIKETTLTLPEGVQAAAGSANGLDVCHVGAAGFNGRDFNSAGIFEEDEGQLQAELAAQSFTAAPAGCPEAGKIGSVEVETPLLPHTLTGGLYLASQNTNPFKPPLVLYLIASEEEPIHHEWSKVLIKLAGEIKIAESGRLISVFKNTPQAPFEHLRIHLFGGERAAQATPARCGPYPTTATFVPWAEQLAPVTSSSSFQITSGPGGRPCPGGGPLPFGPGFEAGAQSSQAGAFSPFELTIQRPDGQQAMSGLTMTLPQGAAAMLASVTPCPVAIADVGHCTEASFIGDAVTRSGLGTTPLTLSGKAYLTESLGPGEPFGVSLKTEAVPCTPARPVSCAGPFNIGTIIANSSIKVDPFTAAATITAVETRIIESTGKTTIIPGLPTMIKGVPVQLKTVHVVVDRPNFEFNPTNCSGSSVTGAPLAINDTLSGDEGTSSSHSTPYAVTGCGNLAFTPKFTAEVKGPGSKLNGTTFTVKVESTRGQANIAKTFLQLPIALPSRLSTIQQACLAATFERNPARCGEGSNIGFAIAHTPVLKKPLTGPAYLVSHGNAAFPDVEFVLQSEGVVVILDGKTDIKKGITYSRFETIPDAPVEKFETVLPEGPHSALTANVPESEHFNLCKHASELVMPTEITGQNGTVVRQTTQIALTGCGSGGVLSFCEAHKANSKCKLEKALKACRKKYKGNSKAIKKKRASCEAQAKKKYGKTSKKHKKGH